MEADGSVIRREFNGTLGTVINLEEGRDSLKISVDIQGRVPVMYADR